jgi:hypothetical protein
MDWAQPLDLYCERFTPDLFAEPLNAVSNLGFVAAGLWLLTALPRRFAPRRVPAPIEVLAALVILVGVCSAAFHTFATRWAAVLDSGAIALFIGTYVICFAHIVHEVRWPLAWMAAPAFWAFGVFVQAPFDPDAFNGSVGYFPALVGLLLMAAALVRKSRAGAVQLGVAGTIFAISLYLRSVDLRWCTDWIWGTHWAWHLLNSLTLALAVLGLARASADRA